MTEEETTGVCIDLSRFRKLPVKEQNTIIFQNMQAWHKRLGAIEMKTRLLMAAYGVGVFVIALVLTKGFQVW